MLGMAMLGLGRCCSLGPMVYLCLCPDGSVGVRLASHKTCFWRCFFSVQRGGQETKKRFRSISAKSQNHTLQNYALHQQINFLPHKEQQPPSLQHPFPCPTHCRPQHKHPTLAPAYCNLFLLALQTATLENPTPTLMPQFTRPSNPSQWQYNNQGQYNYMWQYKHRRL